MRFVILAAMACAACGRPAPAPDPVQPAAADVSPVAAPEAVSPAAQASAVTAS